MTEYEFRQAVSALVLQAGIVAGAAGGVPNGSGFSPPRGLWLRLGFSGAQGLFAGFGDMPLTRRTGLVTMQCFVPAAEYTGALEEAVGALVRLLEWHFAPGFELQAAETADVGLSDDGLWWQKNVRVPFLIKAV